MYVYQFDKEASHRVHISTYLLPKGYPIPDDVLTTPPPPLRDGFIIAEVEGMWVYLEDHRGEVGYLNGELITITELGKLPDGFLTPEEFEVLKDSNVDDSEESE